jgi:hypothetical protein
MPGLGELRSTLPCASGSESRPTEAEQRFHNRKLRSADLPRLRRGRSEMSSGDFEMFDDRVGESTRITQLWLLLYDQHYCRSAQPVCAAMHLVGYASLALEPLDWDNKLGERRSWLRILHLLSP